MPAVAAVAFFAQLLTALLLYNQYRASRYVPIFILSLTYASTSLLLFLYVLTLPHLFSESGLFGAGSQASAWLYFEWHALFVVLVLIYLYFDRFAALELMTPKREAAAMRRITWLVVVATLLAGGVPIWFHDVLPQIVDGTHGTRLWGQVLVPGLLGLYGLALIVLAIETRFRAVAQLTIGMVLIACFFEVLIGNVLASSRFTSGWYLAWVEWIIAAMLFLGVLLYHVYQVVLELATSNRALLRQTRIDELTGLLNRRGFNANLEEQWRHSKRTRRPLSLLLIDVDDFKRFNDRFGHPAGDDALISVAEVLSSFTRDGSDSASRIGGEEFGVVLGETGEAGGLALAERIRRSVEHLRIPQASDAAHTYVTISIGLASTSHDAEFSPADLTMLADQALYTAKASGRNCTRSAADDEVAARRSRLRVVPRRASTDVPGA